jgi:hypothetical protein
MQERNSKSMEPINEIDETILNDVNGTASSAYDRDQSDIIKVKKVCKCSLIGYQS